MVPARFSVTYDLLSTIHNSQFTHSAPSTATSSLRCFRCDDPTQIFDDLPHLSHIIMSKPKTSPSGQQATDSAKGKKTAPINHVILKRIGDLKALVSDLVDSNEDKAIADLDLGQEIHKHASEIEALRNEMHQFQSGILSSFCDALDQRLQQSSVVSTVTAIQQKTALSVPAVEPKVVESNSSSEEELTEGLEETSWESIRSAFLVEHEITPDADGASTTDNSIEAVQPADADFSAGTLEDRALEDSLQTTEDSAAFDKTTEDCDADLDFKHSDIIADLDSLDESMLKSLVTKQEQFISELICRLRAKHDSRPTMTAEQLESVQQFADEPLAEEIRNTLAVLNDQQRQGELELSLERAKLSRRHTELDQLEARIAGRARTLGVTITDNGDLAEAAVTERGTGTKSRRWLGAMGFGNT